VGSETPCVVWNVVVRQAGGQQHLARDVGDSAGQVAHLAVGVEEAGALLARRPVSKKLHARHSSQGLRR
jgi:hypothetical protein